MKDIIKIKRIELGLTQEALAEKLNVTPQAISKWERGVGAPDSTSLLSLSKLFSVTTDELLTGKLRPIEEITGDPIAYFNHVITPYYLNDKQIRIMRSYCWKYGNAKVKECLELAFKSYLPNDRNLEDADVDHIFKKLGGILYNRSLNVVDAKIAHILNKAKQKFSCDRSRILATKTVITTSLSNFSGDNNETDELKLRILDIYLSGMNICDTIAQYECLLRLATKKIIQSRIHSKRLQEGYLSQIDYGGIGLGRCIDAINEGLRNGDFNTVALAIYAGTTWMVVHFLENTDGGRLYRKENGHYPPLYEMVPTLYRNYGRKLSKASYNRILKFSLYGGQNKTTSSASEAEANDFHYLCTRMKAKFE